MKFPRSIVAVLAALVAASCVDAPAPAPDEPQTFNAFAVVQATGKAARTGDGKLNIAPALAGPFLVETDEGPILSGKISCSGSVQFDAATTRTAGKGTCTMIAEDGATSTGEWQCEGFIRIGCRGPYRIVSGTGRFAAAAGEATMIWRPTPKEMPAQFVAGQTVNVSGVLLFRDFKVTGR